jgi:sugar diacid utilization regulator
MEHPSFLSLVQIARTIVSSVSEEHVLDLILKTAIDTIQVADTGFLFLYDPKLKKLLVHSAVGFHPSSYTMTRLSPGEGISGRTFVSEKPVRLDGEDPIRSAMSNMTDFNLRHYLEATTKADYPYSCISVPMMFHDRCIGVLTIDNFTHPSAFTDEDLQLLQVYADLAAVVYENHKLFRQVQEQNSELSLVHEALRKEHERLQASIDFHNRLSNLAAKGYGTPEIVAALYDTVKSPVAVFDLLLTPVVQQPKEHKFSLPDHFLQHQAIQWVQRTKKWQRVNLEDSSETIIVTPIVGMDRLLGYLCTWTDPQGFVETGKLIFEYTATVLALDWVKKEAIRESQARVTDAFLEDVLSGDMTTQLQEQARYLGLEKDDHYAVLLLMPLGAKQQNALERMLDKLQINRLSVQNSHRMIVVFSLPAKLTGEQRQKKLRTLLRELGREKKLEAGIGRLYQGIDKVRRSYRDAQQCLELAEKQGHDRRIVYFGDLGIIRFFMQHSREELGEYLHDVLHPVFRYDEEKGTPLLATLVAYVKFDKDLKSTTQALSIHYNTLYYRIRRVQELLGYSFDEGEEWFGVKLACHIYQYLQDEPNP